MEAFWTDVLVSQGSCNRPQVTVVGDGPHGSVSVESSLRGLQVEVSETCVQCLSRVSSLLPRWAVRAPKGPANGVSPPAAPGHPPLLLKVDLSLEDTNIFTLSNVAGEYMPFLSLPGSLHFWRWNRRDLSGSA